MSGRPKNAFQGDIFSYVFLCTTGKLITSNVFLKSHTWEDSILYTSYHVSNYFLKESKLFLKLVIILVLFYMANSIYILTIEALNKSVKKFFVVDSTEERKKNLSCRTLQTSHPRPEMLI